MFTLFSEKDCHPYLPTFLNILETDNSDQIEKKFIAILLFSPPAAVQEIFRKRPVDAMNELYQNNISPSPSRDDIERLKKKCEQELLHPVVPSVRPIFTQYASVGKEKALQNLLLPSNLEPLSSCGMPVASLNTFPLDSPRNYPYSELLVPNEQNTASTPLPELTELLENLCQFGSLELQVIVIYSLC